jgi:hypothetical protein
MSDETAIADDELSRRAGIDVALPRAVYTGVQMLEIYSKTAIFRNFSGLSARRSGGSARSARRCRITRSDLVPARRDSAGPFQNRVAVGAPKLQYQFPLIVHYHSIEF